MCNSLGQQKKRLKGFGEETFQKQPLRAVEWRWEYEVKDLKVILR
jgi:hypothetical protein